jgi:hypothetical protein
MSNPSSSMEEENSETYMDKESSKTKPNVFQIMKAQSKVVDLRPVFHLTFVDYTVSQFLAIFMKGHGKITSYTMEPFRCPIDCKEKHRGKLKVSLATLSALH